MGLGEKMIQKALFEACQSLIEVWKMVCKEVFGSTTVTQGGLWIFFVLVFVFP